MINYDPTISHATPFSGIFRARPHFPCAIKARTHSLGIPKGCRQKIADAFQFFEMTLNDAKFRSSVALFVAILAGVWTFMCVVGSGVNPHRASPPNIFLPLSLSLPFLVTFVVAFQVAQNGHFKAVWGRIVSALLLSTAMLLFAYPS
jgi:hypothetical protein